MAQQVINNGEAGSVVRGKLNDNFTELYSGIDAVTVATFAALPAPASATGKRYWVLASSGVWLVNRQPKGAYYSDGLTWTWLGDAPITAVELGFTPGSGIAAVNTQAAIEEVVADTATLLAGKAGTAVVTSVANGLAPLTGGGTTNFLRADGTWVAPPFTMGLPTLNLMPLAGGIISNSFNVSTLTTQAQVAGVMTASPFMSPFAQTIDQVGLSVSTLLAASNSKVLIFDANANGRPTTLLASSPDITCAAAATVFVSLSFSFTAGKMYWIAVWSSSTQTLRAVGPGGAPVLGYTTAATPVASRCLQRTLAYGTANDWVFANSQIVSPANPLLVLMRTT